MRPPPGPDPGQASPNRHLRWCSKHSKLRDPTKTFQLTNGDFECYATCQCMPGSAHSKPERKEAARAPKPDLQQGSAAPSRLPPKNSKHGTRASSLSPNRGHRGHKRRSPGSPARPRLPSPKLEPLSTPLSIADSLFLIIDTNPMKLKRTIDGYFHLKDLMQTWGRKHDLSTDEVLNAIAGSLFKSMRNETRANFLIFQEDEAGADILLSIPVPSVR